MKTGCDIVENKRFSNINDSFVKKVLTNKEIELFNKCGLDFIAGRFAAKEAIMKCFDCELDNFLEIEILKDINGKPQVNIPNVEVSISHEDEYTVAFAIRNDV